MIVALITILVLIFTVKILKNSFDSRIISIFIVILLLFDTSIKIYPSMPFMGQVLAFISSIFLFSLFLFQRKYTLAYIQYFPLNRPLIAMCAITFFFYIISDYISGLKKIGSPLINCCLYFMQLIIPFIILRKYSGDKTIFRTVLICTLILFLVGVLNYVYKGNIYMSEIAKYYIGKTSVGNIEGVSASELMLDMYADVQRFRVSSVWRSPFVYGYVSIVTFLYFLFMLVLDKYKNILIYIGMLCSLFGIFFCNCRSVLVTFLISFFIFIFNVYKFSKVVKILFYCLIFVLITIFCVPQLSTMFDMLIASFTTQSTSSQIQGSSIAMRLIQFEAVIEYFSRNPILGNGVNFFVEYLGWGTQNMKDMRLFGLESILFNLLLERGLVGLLVYSYFYFSILRYLIKCKKINRYYSSFGIALLTAYFSFAMITGELNSVSITLFFIGIVIVKLEKIKKNGCIDHNS